MKRLIGAFVFAAACLVPGVATAHPLGNFTVNHYSRVEPAGDRVRVVYVLDMAEIPSFQEKPRIDANPAAYADGRAEELRQNLRLDVNGQPAQLRLEQRSLTLPAGQGGLPTVRLEAVFIADLDADRRAPVDVVFRDGNDPARIGWREIVARPGTVGTAIERSSVPAEDVTNELRQYPDDLLNSPLNVREARLTFVPGAAATPVLSSNSIGVLDRTRSVFAELANGVELTPSFILFAVGVAIVLGAAHALQPGHGKTIVAAYLIGSRGTARHALFLGATVTATHTAGVYALGLVTLFLSQYVLPERLYPILEIASGLLVVAIGIWLLCSRLLSALGLRRANHQHGHDHAHALEPDHHQRAHGHDDRHSSMHEGGEPYAHPHAHEHPNDGGHDHAKPHGHGRGYSHIHQGAEPHDHAQGEGGTWSREREPFGHPNAERGTRNRERVSWRSLLALGVSGGLLPCPEALMVLLITIAAHRVVFGLLLIVSFSTGLAAVLVGFGLLLVYARGFFSRLNLSSGLVPRLLPVASALVIVIAGSVITVQALPQVL